MAGNYICVSYKKELFERIHDHTSDTFKLALYSSDASLGSSTTVYSTTNEVSGTGYSAGGVTLTAVAPTSSGETGYTGFSNVTLSTVTITARYGLVYNSSRSNRAVMVLDFGRNITKTAQDFTVTFPSTDKSNAVLRID